MDALIEPLDIIMPTIHTIPYQFQAAQAKGDTTSHVWMRPCPQCASHLRKKSPEESWRCGCGWRTD